MLFILKVIGALLILTFLILIHELGHYWAARRNGVKVPEFAIGFGPTLYSFKKAGTLFKVNLFFFGGYVKLHGEDAHDPALKKDKSSFVAKTPWQKIEIVLGGVVMNFLAFWIFLTIALIIGVSPLILSKADFRANLDNEILQITEVEQSEANFQLPAFKVVNSNHLEMPDDSLIVKINDKFILEPSDLLNEMVDYSGDNINLSLYNEGVYSDLNLSLPSRRYVIGGFVDNSPALQAGLQQGDTIVAINDLSVSYPDVLMEVVKKFKTEELTYTVIRNGEELDFLVKPDVNGFVGIYLTVPLNLKSLGFDLLSETVPVKVDVGNPYKLSWYMAPIGAIDYGWQISKETVKAFSKTVLNIFVKLKVSEEVGGPIQVAKLSYDFVGLGGTELLKFIALLSLSLAVLNLMPIPALDGGRLLFIIVEAFRSKPLNPKIEGLIHYLGFIFLMGLILFISIFDIIRLYLPIR